MTEPVGSSTVALDGDRDAVRSRETNLGDLIADAMLWKTGTLDAQAAIQNGGGIRASIPVGEVTMGQVLEVLPFGNEISTVTLTGEALVAAIENGVSQVEAGAGRFPQVAGIHFSYDLSAEPGARIRSIDVWNPEARDYQPVAAGDTYVVAVNSFLADGGDGYDALTTATARYDTGWLLSDVLAEYLEAVSPISAAMEGRIRMDGENEETPTLDTD
jgi:5'-nucleotidase